MGLVESGVGTLNLAVHGVGGALMSLLWRMEWDNGRILGGVEGSSQVIPNLKWEMSPMLDSSIICGVGIWSLRKPFHNYIALLAQKILLLLLTWSFLVIPFNGM
jgi:hypothetical protein